ncbi:MAG TPA: PDZ domain-containing protein [Gemmatimonadales bacterium]|nr:PDZ domain-containing protein [Gemmatimonadales bacterium]
MTRFPKCLCVAVLTALLLAPAAMAQGGEPPRPRIFIDGKEVPANLHDMLFTRRARLGITVDLRAQPNDSIGATVTAVTPGGPGFTAGIQSGDIIVRMDGTLLVTGPRPVGAEPDQSLPGLRLIELASRLHPDVTVAIEYKRGNQRRTVSLVTGNEPIPIGDLLEGERRLFFGFPDSNAERQIVVERARDPFVGMSRLELSPMGRFTDLELAPLNPDLGSYFGTTDGVLVVRAGERSSLGLKGGDVLLAIDGRAVTTPAAALRILRSYDSGEPIRFEVQRNRQRQVVNATMSRNE